jgi:PAS domain-containing protein
MEIHELVSKLLATLPHQLVLVDQRLRIVWVNDALIEAWQIKGEYLGRPLDSMFAAKAQQPELWRQIAATASGGQAFTELEVKQAVPEGGERIQRWTARFIPQEHNRRALTLFVIENLPAARSKE